MPAGQGARRRHRIGGMSIAKEFVVALGERRYKLERCSIGTKARPGFPCCRRVGWTGARAHQA
jgi:hypothetical protein